jgi:hypothetical protein
MSHLRSAFAAYSGFCENRKYSSNNLRSWVQSSALPVPLGARKPTSFLAAQRSGMQRSYRVCKSARARGTSGDCRACPRVTARPHRVPSRAHLRR